MRSVRDFYERHPYPPVPALALPRRGEGASLRFELGAAAAGAPRPHDGLRIAVVGGGTLEPLVVGRAHPRASELVAVDLSRRSLAVLGRRVTLARVTGGMLGRGRLPPIRRVAEDLEVWEDRPFDYIVATNVLHHHRDPLGLLARLADRLRDGGILRLVTYPRHSRFWLRATGRWLRLGGVVSDAPGLVRAARRRIRELPAGHPVRLSFEDNPESKVSAGVADAYLHPCENPMPPAEWGAAAAACGLELVAEGQSEHSRSEFLDALAPELAGMTRWEKLQVLDDLLELAANPVLWLVKRGSAPAAPPDLGAPGAPSTGSPPGDGLVLGGAGSPEETARTLAERDRPLWLPSDLHYELADGLRRVAARTRAAGVDVRTLVAALGREVGPRVSWRDPSRELPGLTVAERDPDALLGLPRPWGAAEFTSLAATIPGTLGQGDDARIEDVARTVERLQLEVGASRPWIGPLRWCPS